MAAVPRRPRAAGVPRERLAGRIARSTSASPMRSSPRRAARIRSSSSRTTTSRCCRRMIRAAPAGGDHPDVLAHPLAESGVVRHLPVAARDPRGPARQHRSSASTRAFTARTSSRRPIAISRRASSTSTRRSRSRRRRPSSRAIRSRSSGRRRRPQARWPPVEECRAACSPASGSPPRSASGHRRRPLRLHQGHPRAAARGRAAAREAPGVDRPVHPGAGRRADPQLARRNTARSRNGSSACRERINERFGTDRLPARDPARRAPRATRRSTSSTAPPTSAW